jgi:hypothetical protein
VDTRYTGGPEPAVDRIMRWLRPRGGMIVDGIRLAAINVIGLMIAILWVAAVSLVTRLLDRVIPVPVLFTGFFAVVVALVIGAWIWHRYGAAHGDAARASGTDPRPDVFAAIGASPFVAIAVVLLSFGIFGLFFAAITFSGARLTDSLRQLGFSVLFFAVAVTNLVIVRASSGGMTRAQ